MPELILESSGTLTVPATSEIFIAQEKFVINEYKDVPMRIARVGEMFREWFLGKIEDPMGETVIRRHKIKEATRTTPIIEELGGEGKVETTLTEMYAWMEREEKDKKRDTCIGPKVFFVRDAKGNLRVAMASRGAGWLLGANDLVTITKWSPGDEVFSRSEL